MLQEYERCAKEEKAKHRTGISARIATHVKTWIQHVRSSSMCAVGYTSMRVDEQAMGEMEARAEVLKTLVFK